jgi:hypothetical protein
MSGVPDRIIGGVPNIPVYWSRSFELWTTKPFGVSRAAREAYERLNESGQIKRFTTGQSQ